MEADTFASSSNSFSLSDSSYYNADILPEGVCVKKMKNTQNALPRHCENDFQKGEQPASGNATCRLKTLAYSSVRIVRRNLN